MEICKRKRQIPYRTLEFCASCYNMATRNKNKQRERNKKYREENIEEYNEYYEFKDDFQEKNK